MTKTFENSGGEKEFLDIYRREEMDKYVKPSVTVDSVIFRYYEGRVQTLLIKRKNHPFMGKYALSGGFVQEQEDLNLAVCREVQEETSVKLWPHWAAHYSRNTLSGSSNVDHYSSLSMLYGL